MRVLNQPVESATNPLEGIRPRYLENNRHGRPTMKLAPYKAMIDDEQFVHQYSGHFDLLIE